MAIIIPSKSIYRQNNPKVRDNVVDKYTINSKNVVSANEFDTVVANKTIGNANKGMIYREEPNYGFDIDYAVSKIPNPPSAGDPHYYATLIVGCQDIVPIFKKVIFYVPKQFNTTKVISSLNNLIDTIEEGNTKKTIPKINYTVTSNLYIGDGQVDVEIPSEFSELERSNIKIINTYPRNFSNASPQKVKFTTDNLKMDVNRVVGGGEYPIISRKFNYFYIGEGKENGTISAVIKEEGNKYKIETEVIVGCYLDSYYTFETGLAYADLVDHPFDNFQQLKGESKFYEPLSIEFTLNGDIIGIDLENNTLEYTSKNGKANFSIDGNELTQTTNYYETEDNLLLEKQANNILDAYQNGKETATIRCSIVDYYDENGNLAISTSGQNLLDANSYLAIYNATFENGTVIQNNSSGNNFQFDLDYIDKNGYATLLGSQILNENKRIYFTFEKTNAFTQIIFSRYDKDKATSIYYDVSMLKNGETYTFSANVTIEINRGLCSWSQMQITVGKEQLAYEPFIPMCFQQYAEVIPMDYAVVNGKTQDVPMSRYKDGTPKHFQVLSTNIDYDGSVMQTLELQEILHKQEPTFSRVYTVEFLLDNYVYAKKTTVDGKVYELPDAPSISAGYYFDDWYTEPNGGGEKVTTDTPFTKDTKVYANVVEDMSYTVNVTFHDTLYGTITKETNNGGYLNQSDFPPAKNMEYQTFGGYMFLENNQSIKVSSSYKFIKDTDVYPYYVDKSIHSLLNGVYEKIYDNSANISNAYSQIGTANKHIGELFEELGIVKSEIDNVTEDILGINNSISNVSDRVGALESGTQTKEGTVYLYPNGGTIYINGVEQQPNPTTGFVSAKIIMIGDNTWGKFKDNVTVKKSQNNTTIYKFIGWAFGSLSGEEAGGVYYNAMTYFALYEESQITTYTITLSTDYGTFEDGNTTHTITNYIGEATTIKFNEFPIINLPDGVTHTAWEDGISIYAKSEQATYTESAYISAFFEYNVLTGIRGTKNGISVDPEELTLYLETSVDEYVFCEGTPSFIGTGQLEDFGIGQKVPLVIQGANEIIPIEAGAIDVNSWDIIGVGIHFAVSKNGGGLVTSFFNRGLGGGTPDGTIRPAKFIVTVRIYDETLVDFEEKTYECLNVFPEYANIYGK